MKISACIIANAIHPVLLDTIESYVHVVAEVCVGLNGEISPSDVHLLRERFPQLAIHHIQWQGYGRTKNTLQSLASNDWILSVDADEQADELLQSALKTLAFTDQRMVGILSIHHYFGDQKISFGAWGKGKKKFIRLFNRQLVQWDDAAVHEQLILPTDHICQLIPGSVQHKTVQHVDELYAKSDYYATLSANKKFTQGKKASLLRPYAAAVFTFLKEYILLLGCLDGIAGWHIAVANASYSFNKYQRLAKLHQ